MNKRIDIFVAEKIGIYDEKNEAMLGGKPIQLEVAPFASRLLTIVSSWEERMVNDFIIDGEEYSVKM